MGSTAHDVSDFRRHPARRRQTHPLAADGVSALPPRERVRRLLDIADGCRKALVLTHDNPDPDSLASAMGLAHLLKRRADVDATVGYGGIVGRAENRAMLRVLDVPAVPVARLDVEDFDLLAIVDTQPEVGNHSLPARYLPDIVLDHHPARDATHWCRFADVGGKYGATSTIVVDYLRAAKVDIPRSLATALFYGIKADTRDLDRQTTDPDVDNYLYLFPKVDKEALNEIEHPALPARYFRLYHQSIEAARVFRTGVVTDLGELYSPDMVAEVAERLQFLEGMRWSLAYGTYKKTLYVSIRTRDGRTNAGKLIRDITHDLGGSAGGHGTMAGARLPMPASASARKAFKHDLQARFFREFGVSGKGTPLLDLELP
jgi:nanoRNase/pAp phosphatase (c-di-AMP/oligoRNAs hydrolase)